MAEAALNASAVLGESASFRRVVFQSMNVTHASACYGFYISSQDDFTVSRAGVLHNYLPGYLIVLCYRKWCDF